MKKSVKSFTLIEMLLGLSIFSLIALSVYSTFSSGMQLNKRAVDVDTAYRQIRWSLDAMERDLENAIAYDLRNSYPDQLTFSGEAGKISFFTPTKDGPRVITYYLKPLSYGSIHATIIGEHHEGNKDIIARYEETANPTVALAREEKTISEYFGGSESTENNEDILTSQIIEDGIKFYFPYLQGEAEDAEIVWKDSWSQPFLPSSVRVAISFVDPNKKSQTMTIEKDIYIPVGYLGIEVLE